MDVVPIDKCKCTGAVVSVSLDSKSFILCVVIQYHCGRGKIGPYTSLENLIGTIKHIPSFDIHGSSPFPVEIIANSSALTPLMEYGSISSYWCMIYWMLVIFWFAPVLFCMGSVQIPNSILPSGSALMQSMYTPPPFRRWYGCTI